MLYKEINLSNLLECHPRVDFKLESSFWPLMGGG